MAEYIIQGPDGNKYKVTAPDSASEKQLNAFVSSRIRRPEEKKQTGTALDPLMHGLTFGFSDTLGGAGAYLGRLAAGAPHERAAAAYDKEVSDNRARLQDYRNQNPVASLGLEAAGSLVSGGPLAKSLQAAKMSVPAIAGIEGGLAGAGFGDENPIEGAAWGSTFGTALPYAFAGAKGLFGAAAAPIVEPFKRRFSHAPDYASQRILRKAIADKDPASILAKADELGPLATMSDVDNVLRFISQGAVLDSPKSLDAAMSLGEARRAGAPNRLKNEIMEATGVKTRLLDLLDDIKARQKRASKPAYDAAYAVDITPDAELVEILNRPGIKNGLRKAMANASNEGRALPQLEKIILQGEDFRFTTENIPDMKVLDHLKQYLDDAVSAAYRSGDAGARSLKIARNALRDKLSNLNPQYAKARQIYAGDAALEEAALNGEKFLSAKTREVEKLTRSMTQSEKEAYLHGAVEAMLERMGRTREGQISQFNFMENANFREKLKKLVGSKANVNKLLAGLKRERRFAETEGLWYLNSQTAGREAARELLKKESLIPGTAEAVRSPVMSTINAGMGAVKNKLGKHSQETIDKIGGLLTTPGNAEDFMRFLNQPSVTPEMIKKLLAKGYNQSQYMAPLTGIYAGYDANR